MKTAQLSFLGIFLMASSLFTACHLNNFYGGGPFVRGSGTVIEETRSVEGISGVNLSTIGQLHIELGSTESLRIEAEDNLLPYIRTEVKNGELLIGSRENTGLDFSKPVNYYLVVKGLESLSTYSSGDIEAPDLQSERFSVNVGSSGDISIRSLESNDVRVRISSSGDVLVDTIKAGTFTADISSSGSLETMGLEAETVTVSLNSSGDFNAGTLKAKLLDGTLSSSGDLTVSSGTVQKQRVVLSSSGDYSARDLESDRATMMLNSSGSAVIRVQSQLKAQLSSSGDLSYVGNPVVDASTNSSGELIRLSR
ncbi:MAG: DUF2807 domain-containing protein [Acidobacteriota bacterium]